MTAEYGLAVQDKKADFGALQGQWQKKLEGYIADFADCPDAAEAMFQLAVAQEYAGQDDEAAKWYGRIVKDFPNAPSAKKAVGARTRLASVGNVVSIRGKSPTGELVDTASYRGKVVLVQYWATYCEPCKADMSVLKELLAKYGKSGFVIVSVSLDQSLKDMSDYVAQNGLSWPQVFEEGGLESRPANDMGILTLPTMILLDAQGKVVNRNVQVAELDRELKKLIQ
jgi:thiol-disulfide isomerase/thioredoxin